MGKIYTVAVIGVGSRGGDAYAGIFFKLHDRFKVVSLCDISQVKLDKYSALYRVPKENCFLSEEEFFKEKRADVLCVCTLDKDHIRNAIAGLRLGYDLLLEKPVSDKREECEQLLAEQKKYGGKVCVCHVLRYAPAYMKVAELLDSGIIGQLVTMESMEQVCYWHQAHSYVRGNWRRREDSTPMILAKCCHDLDLLQYYAKSRCRSVSSIGDLTFFKAENAPDGATERCEDCPHSESCPYSAQNCYICRWHLQGEPENLWPYNVLTPTLPITEDALKKAIHETPYGRCVFHCDNDVVDHQLTQLQFENGVTASLTMTAFTQSGGREMRLHGTKGEIIFSEARNFIEVCLYGQPVQTIQIDQLNEGGHGHGGGDSKLIETLYDILEGRASERTSLASSVESHLIGIAAEESRIKGGELITVHA